MELDKTIEERRSVRKYTDYVVTDDELKQVLEAARLSQSWANTQVWDFVIVRDKDHIQNIVGTFAEKNPATKGAINASALIVACAKTGVSGCYGGKDVTKHKEWFMFDLGMAVQNLCLKAHEIGLGTVVVGLMNHDACAKLINLPEGYEVVAVLPIGRPEALRNSPGRKELSAMTHLERFGEKY
jgi:nitroreductase